MDTPKTDKEKMWATSGTGDDFQCIHVAEAQEMETLLREARDVLHKISMGGLRDPFLENMRDRIDKYLET